MGARADTLVFAKTVRSLLISSSFYQHHFSRRSGRPVVSYRFHDPRHTSVALGHAEDAYADAIQSRMGHPSNHITLDRYGHLFPGA